jgi:hypothetical protein
MTPGSIVIYDLRCELSNKMGNFMIVASLKRSYPELIRNPSNTLPDTYKLQGITTGDWPKLTVESLAGFDDVLVGTYDNMIVTAYRITGTSLVDYDGVEKTRFEVAEPIAGNGDKFNGLLYGNLSEPSSWLIGCPIPGGPWKRGESRGTRRYSFDEYREDHPELAQREEEDFGANMAETLLRHFRGDPHIAIEDYPQLATVPGATATDGPGTGVTIVRQPGGTVVITIPTGTRAQINVEPN